MKTFIQIAIKNLFRNKIRTLMTVLGVGIGIGVFISLVSISQSVQVQVKYLLKSYHFDISIQAKGASHPISSSIDENQAPKLLDINGIDRVSSLIIGSRITKWNQYSVLLGASPDEQIISRVGLVEGRVFTSEKNELIIGELLARKLNLGINDKLMISPKASYKITGIYRLGSRIIDNAVIMSLPKAQEILNRGNQVNLILARVDEAENIDQIVGRINNTFETLKAKNGGDFLSQIRLFRTMDSFFSAVSFISLISCCFIVINTLLMAITERIKEIGILMAIGWNRRMIAMTIAFEALIICSMGYVVGGMLGTFFLWTLNHRNIVGFGWIPVYPVMSTMLLSFCISILLGILSAVYPGIIATRMLPARALMHE
jgi:putative ABC transport system permease protein